MHLVANAGAVVSKDALVEAGVAGRGGHRQQPRTGDLGAAAHAGSADGRQCGYIETVPRRGYRFVADVTRRVARESRRDRSTRCSLPHRAWLDGRAALETLGRAQAAQARADVRAACCGVARLRAAHVGLANACAFEFEATRADAGPDRAALLAAIAHAREACRLEPESAKPWATLGFVLHLTREPQHAIAAARRAIALEPDNWRHHLRLAVVGWGEERLRASQRMPDAAAGPGAGALAGRHRPRRPTGARSRDA